MGIIGSYVMCTLPLCGGDIKRGTVARSAWLERVVGPFYMRGGGPSTAITTRRSGPGLRIE